MGAPIVEQIAQKFMTRLENQTVANGFDVELSSVVRPTRDGKFVKSDGTVIAGVSDRMALLILDTDKRDGASGGGGAKWRRILHLYLILFSIPDDSQADTNGLAQGTILDAVLNDLEASSIDAVTTPEDATDWAKLGGLAITTWLDDVDRVHPTDGYNAGVVQHWCIQYQTPENDPYTTA